jgi:hypothetical protein
MRDDRGTVSSIFNFTAIFMALGGGFIYVTGWVKPQAAADLFGWQYAQPHLQRSVGVFHLFVAAINHHAARSGSGRTRKLVQILNFWTLLHYTVETLIGAFGWFAFLFASSLWLLNLYYSVALFVSVQTAVTRERSMSEERFIRTRSPGASRRSGSSRLSSTEDFPDVGSLSEARLRSAFADDEGAWTEERRRRRSGGRGRVDTDKPMRSRTRRSPPPLPQLQR